MNRSIFVAITFSLTFLTQFTPKLLKAQSHVEDWNGLKGIYENTGISKTANCEITSFEIESVTDANATYTWSYNGNPSYYALQTKFCPLSFKQNNSNCPPDLWTEIPDAAPGAVLFESCQTYPFRMIMICEGDTLYSNEVNYYYDNGTCNTCNYNNWLWDQWFMPQDCNDCPVTVELIEFNGNQYIAAWETKSSQFTCEDFSSSVYNCDGTNFCSEGFFPFNDFNRCSDVGLPNNYTVLETIYSYNGLWRKR